MKPICKVDVEKKNNQCVECDPGDNAADGMNEDCRPSSVPSGPHNMTCNSSNECEELDIDESCSGPELDYSSNIDDYDSNSTLWFLNKDYIFSAIDYCAELSLFNGASCVDDISGLD